MAQLSGPWRDDVVDSVRAVGFAQAHIDPRGFRSGSMNEARPSGA